MRRTARRVIGILVALAASATFVVVAGPSAWAITICDTVDDVRDDVAATISYETYGHASVGCDFRLSETYNPAVGQLQAALNQCYGPYATVGRSVPGVFGTALQVDGHYGPRTQGAVRSVQTYLNNTYGAGLAVDGYAGPKTRSRMLHASSHADGDYCASAGTNPPQVVSPGPPSPPSPPINKNCHWNTNGAGDFGYGEIQTHYPYTLHGTPVHLFTSRVNGAVYFRAENAPPNSVLSIDRSNFAVSGPEERYFQQTAWIMAQTPNAGYDFCDNWSTNTGGVLETEKWELPIDGAHRYVRACLYHGTWECADWWYGDNDDEWDDIWP